MLQKLHHLLGRAVEIITRRDVEYAEFFEGLAMIVWAVCLGVESQWSLFCAFLGVGIARLAGILQLHYLLRRGAALCGVFIWLLTGGLLAEEVRVLSCATAFLFAGYASLGYWRIGRRERAWKHSRGAQFSRS